MLRERIAQGAGKFGERFCTQGELIREFGVSSITVRRALHDLEEEDILRQVNGRGVFLSEAAQALVRGPRRKRSGVLSLLLRDRFQDLLKSPFYAPLVDAFETALRKRGGRMISESVAGQAVGDLSLPASIEAMQSDGVALLRSQRNDFLLRLMERRIPLVLMDFRTEELNLDAVVLDNVNGARAAVAHLAALGHRRIGHLAGFFESFEIRSRSVSDRLAGYRAALQEAGLEANPAWVVSGRGAEERAAALKDLLSRTMRPTALFCFSDEWAREALGVAEALGIRVPRDLSVVGFGDMPGPPGAAALTTLRVDPARLGTEAARLLMERVNGFEGPARCVVVPAVLVTRESTAPPPIKPRRKHS